MKINGLDKRITISLSNIQAGLILAGLFLAAVILVQWCVPVTRSYLTSPQLYPYVVLISGTILSLLFTYVFKRNRYELDLTIWPLVLGSVLYYLCMMFFGFLISTFILMFYFLFCWKIKNKKIIILTAILTPAIVYLVFTVFLRVSLPLGRLFR